MIPLGYHSPQWHETLNPPVPLEPESPVDDEETDAGDADRKAFVCEICEYEFVVNQSFDLLLSKAKHTTLTNEEMTRVIKSIKQVIAGKKDDIICLLQIVGETQSKHLRTLVEHFLVDTEDSAVSRVALSILVNRWGLTQDYLNQIKLFISGVQWDRHGKLREMALSIAGAYLRKNKDRELSTLLLDVLEDQDLLLRTLAYKALAKSVGQTPPSLSWGQMIVRKMINITMLKEAYRRVGKSISVTLLEDIKKSADRYDVPPRIGKGFVDSQIIRSTSELLNEAKNGRLFYYEEKYIAEQLSDPMSSPAVNWAEINDLLEIVGHVKLYRYRRLVDNLLDCPPNPSTTRLALEILTIRWDLADAYLNEIKILLHGVEWDVDGQIRQMAVLAADKYLQTYYDPELYLLLQREPTDEDFSKFLGTRAHILRQKLVEIPSLDVATEDLYRTFSKYQYDPLVEIEFCSCGCVDPKAVAPLCNPPLREVSYEAMDKYLYHAISTWGSEEDFLHFLPRAFVLDSQKCDGGSLFADHICSRLEHIAETAPLPNDEINAFLQFIYAYWSHLVNMDILSIFSHNKSDAEDVNNRLRYWTGDVLIYYGAEWDLLLQKIPNNINGIIIIAWLASSISCGIYNNEPPVGSPSEIERLIRWFYQSLPKLEASLQEFESDTYFHNALLDGCDHIREMWQWQSRE